MHIFNAGGSARWGPVPFMKKQLKANGGRMNRPVSVRDIGQTLKEGLRSLETASVRARKFIGVF